MFKFEYIWQRYQRITPQPLVSLQKSTAQVVSNEIDPKVRGGDSVTAGCGRPWNCRPWVPELSELFFLDLFCSKHKNIQKYILLVGGLQCMVRTSYTYHQAASCFESLNSKETWRVGEEYTCSMDLDWTIFRRLGFWLYHTVSIHKLMTSPLSSSCQVAKVSLNADFLAQMCSVEQWFHRG